MGLSGRLSPKTRHRIFIGYMIVMVLVFLTPTPEMGISSGYLDKMVHCALFFGFALVLYMDHRTSPGGTFMMSTVFAVGVELVQWVLPYRDAEWLDFVAGMLGVVLATVPILWIRSKTSRAKGSSRQGGAIP